MVKLGREYKLMQNLLNDLKRLLKKDERLVSEDELLKNKIIELTLKSDRDLINLLMSNKKIKKLFFIKIDKILVFDKDKFIKFISNKEFLPDSYTAFKNKIGLAVIDEFISKKKEVVLSWPYKDCVLEGEQTKEDQKRDEIFWNETLAPDEISRLYDPKVFTNAKRIDKNGEHKLDGFRTNGNGDIKDNLIIEGNNLLALHSLKKQFASKVKLIYIDPPYNTGSDSFGYNDRFNHSTWLTFMKNRLECARELLSDNGSIFVQIDENEGAYLKVLCDEIFGRENFVNAIIWKRTFSHGDVGQGAKHLGRLHDIILLYKKTEQFELNFVYTPYSKDYLDKFYRFKDKNGRRYRLVTMTAPGGASKGNPYYEVMGVKRYWLYSKQKMKELMEAGEVVQTKPGNVPQRKRYLDESRGVPIQDMWLDINPLQGASKEKTDLIGQKSEELLKRIIELVTNEGELVLDFFAGSGTTGVVSHKMNRQYILVEQMNTQIKLLKKRLKKVVDGDRGGISKSVGWRGGGDFVYLELKRWNENFVEKIIKAKVKGDLKNLWKIMKKKAFLSYKVEPKVIDEQAKDFADLSIGDQKRFLLECLDKNHLYVNYSEIDDKDYGVSKEDKELNKEFYES